MNIRAESCQHLNIAGMLPGGAVSFLHFLVQGLPNFAFVLLSISSVIMCLLQRFNACVSNRDLKCTTCIDIFPDYALCWLHSDC